MKSKIDILAVRLAIAFSDESEIPAKYKSTKKRRTKKKDIQSDIEAAFNARINSWTITVSNLFENCPTDEALRFITITPWLNDEDENIALCEDFLTWNEYLEQRRDIDNCCDEELGCLSMLLTAFQRKIEQKLEGFKSDQSKIQLKDAAAQELMEQKTISIDGIDLNLWQGHSFDSVSGQTTWNKIRSYSELNQKCSGENGNIVITGIFQIPRQEAAELAAKLGFKVHSSISKRTDFLIVGSGNVGPTKIADMKRLNEKGAKIKLISEIEFLEMLAENLELIEKTEL